MTKSGGGRQFALASPTPNCGGLVPPVPRDLRPWIPGYSISSVRARGIQMSSVNYRRYSSAKRDVHYLCQRQSRGGFLPSVFPHGISKTDATIRSPNLTEKYSTMIPGNPFILRSKGQMSRSRVTD